MIAATTIQRYGNAMRSLSYAFDTESMDFLYDASGVIAWIEHQQWALSSKKVCLQSIIYYLREIPYLQHLIPRYRDRLRLFSHEQKMIEQGRWASLVVEHML